MRKSLADYKANPVLLIPPLIALIAGTLASASYQWALPWAFSIKSPASPQLLATRDLVIFMISLASLFLLAASFLVTIGQASITGKVVLENKTKLGDWGAGIRRYFFRILGIALVLALIFAVPTIIASVSLSQAAYSVLVGTIINAVSQPVSHFCLGAAILDNRGMGSSLTSGVSAARRSGRVFIGFFILLLIVSTVATFIREIPASSSGTGQTQLDLLTPRSITSMIVAQVFSPLWFLIAFRIYREFSVEPAAPA